MFMKRMVAGIVAIAVMMTGAVATANADPELSRLSNLLAGEATPKCLDFRADVGPYVTDCNWGDYQQWYWNGTSQFTAFRQKATRLCLTLRSTGLTMKPCAADDLQQQWRLGEYDPLNGFAIYHRTFQGQCLARQANNHVGVAASCTQGPSQRWGKY